MSKLKIASGSSKVLNMPDMCSVRMDGELHTSEDFVAVLAHSNGDASILYDTDALTLGMAIKMVTKEFILALEQCTLDEQQAIQSALGDAFILERLRTDETD